MKYLCILSVLLCIGCSNTGKQIEVKKDDIRRAPDIAMIKCEELTPLSSGDFSEIALKLQEISSLYYKCEAKRKALADFIENK